MSETAQVPAEWFAIFQHDTLPGHPANPAADALVEWPASAGGVKFMPMSGKFLVRSGDGSLTAHEDGFLIEDGAGHPVWLASPPD